jgi:hypothetical protein
MPISRGFRGRRRPEADPARVPPGQYVTADFPVLSAGPTPHTPLDEWSFTIRGAVDESRSWTWDEFRALPSETFTVDIHCVTTGPRQAFTLRWRPRTRVSPEVIGDGTLLLPEHPPARRDAGAVSAKPEQVARRGGYLEGCSTSP